MMYTLIGMSLFFLAIGFIVTENNAKYILSGYNTMSVEERGKIDIKAYISGFKKFHIFLGISFFILGCVIHLVNISAGYIFLGVYPIVAYLYFITSSSKFSRLQKPKSNKIGIFVLIAVLVFVVGNMAYGIKENKLTLGVEKIEFEGHYGTSLPINQINSITIENELPEIALKTNGFALGEIRKGYFKTKDGEVVKLILNSAQKPYLLFTKLDGEKIYYSAKGKKNITILNDIKKVLPSLLAVAE